MALGILRIHKNIIEIVLESRDCSNMNCGRNGNKFSSLLIEFRRTMIQNFHSISNLKNSFVTVFRYYIQLFMAPCCIFLFANKIYFFLDLRCYSSVIHAEFGAGRSKCFSPCVGWEAAPKMVSNFFVSPTFYYFDSFDLTFIHSFIYVQNEQ